MSEEEWLQHWQEFKATLHSVMGLDPNRTTPGSEHLDRLASRLGFALPLSYRAFIRVFGPVDVANDTATIFSPASLMKGGGPDMIRHNNWQDKVIAESTDPSHRERLVRAVTFAVDMCQNDYFFWDRAEVTNAEQFEYRIYYDRARREVTPQCVPIADDFGTFIHRACFGGEFNKMIGVTKRANKTKNYRPLGFGPTTR